MLSTLSKMFPCLSAGRAGATVFRHFAACRCACTIAACSTIDVLTSNYATTCTTVTQICDCSDHTVLSKSTSTDPDPRILRLRVLPDLDKPGHKYVLSSVRLTSSCLRSCHPRNCALSRYLQPVGVSLLSLHLQLLLTCRETMSSSTFSSVKT